jgi:hypothetical protein
MKASNSVELKAGDLATVLAFDPFYVDSNEFS